MTNNSHVTPTKHNFLALDALRGVAAIAVMLYHFSPYLGTQLLPRAYLAVDLFFMLSGFVVAYAYEHRLRHGMALYRFTLTRLVRLYPLYALGTLLGAIYELTRTAILHQSHASAGLMAQTLAASTFFVPILNHRPALGGLYPFDPAAWSLFFELLVNLLYAFTILHLTTRRLMIPLGIMAACLAAAAITRGSLDMGMTVGTLAGGAARVMWGFGMGVAISRRHVHRNPWPRWILPLLALGLLALFAAPVPPAYICWFDLVCAMLVFPAGIVMAVRLGSAGGWLAALFGRLSYPVYILHTPLVLLFAGAWKAICHADPAHTAPWAGVLFACLILPCGYAASRFYDDVARARLTAGLDRIAGLRSGTPRTTQTATETA